MASLPKTIKALQVTTDKTHPLNLIELPFAEQEKVSALPPDEIIIKVRAVGLNPTDWKNAFKIGSPGSIAGNDSAGDIVRIGSSVKHLKLEDRVSGFTYGGGTYEPDNGSFAEYVRLPGAVCFKLPDGMTYEEAASFPIPHLTAVQALYMRFSLPLPSASQSKANSNTKNEPILIWGGNTAVGTHAIQLAAHSGLRPFVTAATETHEALKRLGVYACFDYKDPDVVKKITDAAGNDGIVYGLDNVCEKGSTDMRIDAMSSTRPAHVVTMVEITPEAENRRQNVRVEMTNLYTALGTELTYKGSKLHAIVEDEKATLNYVTNELPKLLEAWKESEGSPMIKTQRLRKMEGGLGGILEGLKIMREGKYGREKLVYNIA